MLCCSSEKVKQELLWSLMSTSVRHTPLNILFNFQLSTTRCVTKHQNDSADSRLSFWLSTFAFHNPPSPTIPLCHHSLRVLVPPLRAQHILPIISVKRPTKIPIPVLVGTRANTKQPIRKTIVHVDLVSNNFESPVSNFESVILNWPLSYQLVILSHNETIRKREGGEQ